MLIILGSEKTAEYKKNTAKRFKRREKSRRRKNERTFKKK